MDKPFIQLIEDYYNKTKDKEEVIRHFLELGYKRKKIDTAISDLRRHKRINIAYSSNRCTNIWKPIPINKKIVLFDIETTPLKGWVWSKWNNNLYEEQIIQEWFVLSWSAKYLNDDVVSSDVLTSEEVLNEDDSRIIKNIYKYLEKANIVIAHNAKKFDCKRLNTRFIYYNLPPLDYKIIDTLDEARKHFSFTSSRLDDLAKFFGFEGKNKTSFSLWSKCMQGNIDALEEMRVYNVQDVVVLEKIYKKLRPYIKHHPNLGNMDNKECCPSCGSTNMIRYGMYYTNTSTYPKYRCSDCGSLSRRRQNENNKEKMKNLLVSI